jgi:hydrogenase maturation protease
MSDDIVDKIARAVLYEGYVLYPYRPSVKNTQRWTFGGIYPQAFCQSHPGAESYFMQTQCLIQHDGSASLSASPRFLHLTERFVEAAPDFCRVQSLRVGDREYQPWQEAVEREITVPKVPLDQLQPEPRHERFSFPDSSSIETLIDKDAVAGLLVRQQYAIEGEIELTATPLNPHLTRISVRVINYTPVRPDEDRQNTVVRSFASTHVVLRVTDGQFISLTDPPADLREAAHECRNVGCWPVLAGETNQTNTMLAAPIILPDYPQIAPESPGDLFDATEIDEILTLRILTMTDDEKRQAAGVDDRVRQLLARTESLARQELMNLHGKLREKTTPSPQEQHV